MDDVVQVVQRLGQATQGMVAAGTLRSAGISDSRLSRAVAAGRLLRVRPRVYAVAPLPAWPTALVRESRPVPELVAHARAGLLSLGSRACATGRTAAALRGWGLLVEPTRAVEVAVPHGRSRARCPGVEVRQRRRGTVELLALEGGTLASAPAVEVVVDCCLRRPLLEAVVVLDSALRAGSVSVTAVRRAAARCGRAQDRKRVLRVLTLGDPASGSVLETVLRVRMVLAGIDGFASQVALRDAAGRHVLRADFCFAAARLVVEVDGARWHTEAARDRRVDNALAACGWRVLRYTWAEVVHEPERVLAELREALGARYDFQSALPRGLHVS